MLGKSFNHSLTENQNSERKARFWREKIEINIKKHSSRDRDRVKSCDGDMSFNQLNAMFRFIRNEQVSIKKKLKNQENILKIIQVDGTRELEESSATNASTPIKKNSVTGDAHLVTFRPGANWSDSGKAKFHFPREIFSCRKLF